MIKEALLLGSGGELDYVDRGPDDGRVVLMLHGNPTASDLYSEVIDALDGSFRCIAPDLLGFGDSIPSDGFGFRPVEQAAVVERLVLELDLTGITLVAQDWGGPIGLAVAVRHPDRFDGFVVGNTWAWPMTKRGAGTWSRFFGGPVGSRAMQRFGEQRWPKARLEAIQALGRSVTGADTFLREVEHGLPRLKGKRAAIVWGERDPVFGESELRRWRALWPDAEVTRLQEASHFFQEDAPAEVASAIGSLS